MSTKKTASAKLEKEFGPLYFSDLLKAHRLGEEMSQGDLAKLLKISRQKVCDYEKGRRLPSMETIVKWAKKLQQPHEIWVRAYLQQQVDEAKLSLKVDIKAVS